MELPLHTTTSIWIQIIEPPYTNYTPLSRPRVASLSHGGNQSSSDEANSSLRTGSHSSDNIGKHSSDEVFFVVAIVPVLLLSLLGCAYGIHRYLQHRRQREDTNEHPGDALLVVRGQGNSREMRSKATTNYSVVPVRPAEGSELADADEMLWQHRCLRWLSMGPCLRGLEWVDDRTKYMQEEVNRWGTIVVPNNRREVAKLLCSAGLFYCDIFSDCVVILLFGISGCFWYMLYTMAAIGAMLLRAGQQKSFLWDPARLASEAVSMKVSASVKDKEWGNDHLLQSIVWMRRLSDMRVKMWSITRMEAETEAPLNVLVQMYTVVHEDYGLPSRMVLLASALIGFITLLLTIEAFEETGHTTWFIRLREPQQIFPYVTGTGLTPVASCGVVLFRSLELASRIGTLSSLQAIVCQNLPHDFGARLVLPMMLGVSCLLLFAIGEVQPQPRHGIHCLQGTFFFPGPLSLPPFKKSSVVCCATFYKVRVGETIVTWAALYVCLHWGLIQPLSTLYERVLFQMSALFTLMFTISAPFVVMWAEDRDHTGIREEFASHIRLDANGRAIWPVSMRGATNVQLILESYGFVAPEPHGDDQVSIPEDDKAIQWCRNPKGEAQLQTTNVFFTAEYGLRDEMISSLQHVFKKPVQSMAIPERNALVVDSHIQRMRFLDCRRVTAQGWHYLLGALPNEHIIELGFCGTKEFSLLDDDKAHAVADMLVYFRKLKKLDLAYNMDLSLEGWQFIFDAVRGSEIEELLINNCDLDEEKVAIIGDGLKKLTHMNKLSLGFNPDIPSTGLESLLTAIFSSELQVTELGMQGLELEMSKVLAIAPLLGNLNSLKFVDLSYTPLTLANAWKNLLGPLSHTKIEELALCHGSLNDSTAGSIAEPIVSMSTLQKLNLSHNEGLSADGWGKILKELNSMESLQELQLNYCKFDDAKAEVIVQALKNFKDLWKLDLSYNAGVTAHVWRYLSDCAPLYSLKLVGCTLTQVVRNSLLASMAIKPVKAGRRMRFVCNPSLESGAYGEPCGSEARNVTILRLDLRDFLKETADSVLAQFVYAEELTARVTSEHMSALSIMLRHGRILKVDLTGSVISPDGWSRLFRSFHATYVKELSLRQCGLDEAKAIEMDRVRPEMRQLRKVNLEENSDVTPAGWKSLLSSFRNTSAEEFGDIFLEMSNTKAASVAEGVSALKELRRVDFSKSKDIRPETWKKLIRALKGKKVEEIRLELCELDDEKAEAIASEMPKLNIQSLQSISIIGEEETINQTLIVNVVSASGLVKTHPQNDPQFYCICRVQDHYAFRTKVIDDTTSPVWKEEHRISNYSADEKLVFEIVDASFGVSRKMDQIVARASLSSDEFIPDDSDNNQRPGKIDFQLRLSMSEESERRLTEHSILRASSACSVGGNAHSILRVRVQIPPHMKITAVGLEKLLKSMNGAQVRDLGGILHEMDAAKAKVVAAVLPKLTTLQKLDFMSCLLVSAEAWKKILNALGNNTTIQELVFCRCRLNDAKAEAIAEGLTNLRSLLRIDFSWNREVSGPGWVGILRSLQCTEIQELNFLFCGLDDEKLKFMSDELAKLRRTLKQEFLHLDQGNSFSEEGFATARKALKTERLYLDNPSPDERHEFSFGPQGRSVREKLIEKVFADTPRTSIDSAPRLSIGSHGEVIECGVLSHGPTIETRGAQQSTSFLLEESPSFSIGDRHTSDVGPCSSLVAGTSEDNFSFA